MYPYQESTLLVIDQANPTQFKIISSDSFIRLNIWERNHIQEWIRKAPQILGEDLLVLAIEFDRFLQSADRLDILALDKKGNLVVVELKRDGFAAYADLQAIRYAAMVSSMTIENLLPYMVDYKRKQCQEQDYSTDKALEELKEFVVKDEFTELSNRPHIILCSENFSTELTTNVLWLNQCGLDISCVRIRPHRVDEKIVVVPTVIIPVPEAKQYQTEIQKKEEAKQDINSCAKRPTTIKVLWDAGKIKAGDRLVVAGYLPDYVKAKFDGENPYFQAEITGKQGKVNAVRWLHDGNEYSISNLTHIILTELHPKKLSPTATAGGSYWKLVGTNQTLYDWADEVWNEQNQEQN